MKLLRQPRPLHNEYAGFFLLRYPRLREAYEQFLVSAQVGIVGIDTAIEASA